MRQIVSNYMTQKVQFLSVDKRIESIEKNRKGPPSSGASAFVIDIFSQAPLIEIDWLTREK